MQPQENPARVLQGLHGNSTQGFFLEDLYCLECSDAKTGAKTSATHENNVTVLKMFAYIALHARIRACMFLDWQK